ncbi:hypothetical protein [uncultured Enterovirga sp.]|uniref:hypothetical protein n=1 Tax=uncultured Enterovirga sp. TaxID=2026352 RepID=UPI0035CA2269
MRIAFGFAIAATVCLVGQAALAAERRPSPSPVNDRAPSAGPAPAAKAAPKATAPAAAAAGPSGRDDSAIRASEERDRRREARMLKVTRSICRGC